MGSYNSGDRQRDIFFYSIVGSLIIALVGVFIMVSGHIVAGLFVIISAILVLTPIKDKITQEFPIPRFILNIFVVVFFLLGIRFIETNGDFVESSNNQYASAQVSPPKNTTKDIQATSQNEYEYIPVEFESKQTQGAVGYPQTNVVVCTIVSIYDGDTATCLTNDKTQIKIRLNQIDAPEKGQAFGNASKQALSALIFQKLVTLDIQGTDKYGRTIAEVYQQNINVNKSMVAQGMAWAYREYLKDNEYLLLEESARKSHLGIWSEPNPIYPSDYRRSKRGQQSQNIQTTQIRQEINQQALTGSNGQCGSKRYCSEMINCSEAKHYLNVCGVTRLDRDNDGIPCESLCR